ncbi:sideroflexin-4 [Symphorus nematophorus]
MDPNLLYWKSHGQSFLSRLKIWFNVLDPTSLLSSDAEILKAHALLGSGEKPDEKDVPAHILSLVVASFLPHKSVQPALFWQLLLQSYSAGFNYANRNSSSEQQGKKPSMMRAVLIAATVSYTTCAGALPQILINRLRITYAPIQTFLRSILPIPLSAAVAFLSVLTIRDVESETGIQVFDSNGNPVGFSKAAGGKAVRETALSRAALFATTAAVPNLLGLLLQRRKLFQKNPLLVVPVRHTSVVLALGLMIPISFSLFPQLGTIKRENVEEELQAAADNGQLYYHRGL